MSSALGLAAVSAALRGYLEQRLGTPEMEAIAGGPVGVACESPATPVKPGNGGAEPSRLTLFLYAVGRNPGWANATQPERNSAGARTAPAVLGLDLHYLLTAHGAAAYAQEAMLGGAMLALAEAGVLGRETIRRLLPADADPGGGLALAGLADQVETIRVTQEPLDLDAMSKLWSVLQAPDRPRVAYKVTVALLEAKSGGAPPPPPLGAALAARGLLRPTIDLVANAAPGDPPRPITAGETLLVQGSGLFATGAQVLLDGVDMTAQVVPGTWRAAGFQLALPAVLPAGVEAGTRAIQVMLPAQFAAGPRGGELSNPALFLLRPKVGAAEVSGQKKVNGGRVAALIAVPVTPPVRRGQRVELLLTPAPGSPAGRGGVVVGWAPPLVVGTPPPEPKPAFAVEQLPAGDWLYRIAVDGADSALTMGAGGFEAPVVGVVAPP